MVDPVTGYPLYDEPEAPVCYCEEDNMCAPCQAATRRRRIQAGSIDWISRVSAPAPRRGVASIGNGLYVRTAPRTRRAS